MFLQNTGENLLNFFKDGQLVKLNAGESIEIKDIDVPAYQHLEGFHPNLNFVKDAKIVITPVEKTEEKIVRTPVVEEDNKITPVKEETVVVGGIELPTELVEGVVSGELTLVEEPVGAVVTDDLKLEVKAPKVKKEGK
jgi:hypothetical protein